MKPVLRQGLILSLLLALCSCAREEKVLYYKPFFSGIQDAKTQTAPVLGPQQGKPEQVEDVSQLSLVKKNPDGSKTLISKSGLHLMAHIRQTLADNDEKTFTSQVLSEITRDEFREHGRDPSDAFKALKPHEKDIAKLFSRMPLGEHSPNVSMQSIGHNMFRVQVTGRSTDGLEWTGFDMVLENGNWRLRWLVR